MKVFLAGRPTPDIRDDWRFKASAGRVVTPPLVGREEMWHHRSGKCLFGAHELAGPYYTEDGELNGIDDDHRSVLVLTAILQSELIFAWLDVPDPDVFWALGFAQASEIPTAVGSSAPLAHSHVFYRLSNFRVEAKIPAEALLRAITNTERERTFFGGTWKRLSSKFDGVCASCEKFYSVGEDIMWKRLEGGQAPNPEGKKTSVAMHVACFMHKAPIEVIPKDLQMAAADLLQKKNAELEKKNALLFEAIRDLAGSTS